MVSLTIIRRYISGLKSKAQIFITVMDCDDFFGDDDVINDEATTRKVASKLYNDGYRIGKAKEEEVQMQIGFDKGFERGMLSGRTCGKLYASCREYLSNHVHTTAEATVAMSNLEAVLFESIAESGFITDDSVTKIGSIVLSMSRELESAVILFANEAKSIADLS